jgi:carboxymethylenebutenolidase
MNERRVEITAEDGRIPTFVAWPDGEGPFPVALVLMDGMGIREELRDLTRRLSSSGYYAMLPDLYYRLGAASTIESGKSGEWDRMVSLIKSLSDEMVIRDVEALLEYADADPAAADGAAGILGFCMGGRLALALCQGLGRRIAAAAAIHPGLEKDADDSAHRDLDRVSAELYLAIADQDPWCSPEQVSEMEKVLVDAGVPHEIEFHPGAPHGFGVPGSGRYDERAAERAWKRVEALFSKTLG